MINILFSWKLSKSPGQSVSEYALVVALIGVVSIPVILDLSSAIETGFQTSVAPKPSTGKLFNQTYAQKQLLKSGVTSAELGPYQADYNAQTGQITYKLPESMGGGSVTTSVEGSTDKMADILLALMAKWQGSDGEKAPDDLRAMVKDLAAIGKNMSAAQAGINEQNINCSKGEYGCANTWPLIYLTKDYNTQFQAVTQKASQLGSNYSDLKSAIEGYSGVISSVTYSNYLQGSYQYSTGINQEVYDLVEGNSHFGQEIHLKATLEETPVITSNSSDGIARQVRRK